MKKYVSLGKRSKKAQKEYYSRHRCTWGELNPVTKSVPSGKTYNRKKDKKRIGREFSDEFNADYLLCLTGAASCSCRQVTEFVVLISYRLFLNRIINGYRILYKTKMFKKMHIV